MNLDYIRDYLKNYDGRSVNIMEVCGSHTGAISKYGIPHMLSPKIHLISGPGCPVCVTPSAYIDRLIEIAKEPDFTVVTFGDLMRVPGSVSSLSAVKGQGADVRMVYSPMEVLEMAKNEPDRTFVFAAVGFETTAPVNAGLVEEVTVRGLENVKLLTAIKTMPAVINELMEQGAEIDGFLAPGHVAVVTGSKVFEPLAKRYSIPFVVAGFTGERILVALYDIVKNIGSGVVRNDYPSVVKAEGNGDALNLIYKYFTPCDAVWRGIGTIVDSGLCLREEYDYLDMGSIALNDDLMNDRACRCGDVLCGRIKPFDCPLFGKTCTPVHPRGACMVSSEGNCFSYFTTNRDI